MLSDVMTFVVKSSMYTDDDDDDDDDNNPCLSQLIKNTPSENECTATVSANTFTVNLQRILGNVATLL